MDTKRGCECKTLEIDEHEHSIIDQQSCPCEIYAIATEILITSISKTLNLHKNAELIGGIERLGEAEYNVEPLTEAESLDPGTDAEFIIKPRAEAELVVDSRTEAKSDTEPDTEVEFVFKPHTDVEYDLEEQNKPEEEFDEPLTDTVIWPRNLYNNPMKWSLLKSSFVFFMGILTIWNGEEIVSKII